MLLIVDRDFRWPVSREKAECIRGPGTNISFRLRNQGIVDAANELLDFSRWTGGQKVIPVIFLLNLGNRSPISKYGRVETVLHLFNDGEPNGKDETCF